MRIRVRDSSEKPAMSVANEVQAWHATSLPADSPTPKPKRRGHALKNEYLNHYEFSLMKNIIFAP